MHPKIGVKYLDICFLAIWPTKTYIFVLFQVYYENMAFFLRKNHLDLGGWRTFSFLPQTWVVKMDIFGHRDQIWHKYHIWPNLMVKGLVSDNFY